MITNCKHSQAFIPKSRLPFHLPPSDSGIVGKVLKYVVTETDELISHDYVTQVHLASSQYLPLDRALGNLFPCWTATMPRIRKVMVFTKVMVVFTIHQK